MPAILDIWYPGTQGGAAAGWSCVGEVSPSGKLPFGWRAPSGRCPSSTPTPAPMSRRTRGDATGTSPAPPCSRSGTASATAGSAIPTSPSTPVDPPGGDRHRVGAGHQHLGPRSRRGRPALPPPTPRLRLPTGPRAQRLPTRHPGIPGVPAGAVHDRSRTGATGAPPNGTGSSTSSIFDVWVGGCSAAELTTTFEVPDLSPPPSPPRPWPAQPLAPSWSRCRYPSPPSLTAVAVALAGAITCRAVRAGRRPHRPALRPTCGTLRAWCCSRTINRNSGPISTHTTSIYRASTGGKLYSCQQVVSSASTRGLASHHGHLPRHVPEHG